MHSIVCLLCCCCVTVALDAHDQVCNHLLAGCYTLASAMLTCATVSIVKVKDGMQGPTDNLPWEGQGAGAGAGAGPSTAGGSALQPWGDAGGGATAGASGGRERSGNAEITPLEVLTPALPDS